MSEVIAIVLAFVIVIGGGMLSVNASIRDRQHSLLATCLSTATTVEQYDACLLTLHEEVYLDMLQKRLQNQEAR